MSFAPTGLPGDRWGAEYPSCKPQGGAESSMSFHSGLPCGTANAWVSFLPVGPSSALLGAEQPPEPTPSVPGAPQS